MTYWPNWVNVTKSVLVPVKGVPPVKSVVVNLAVSDETLVKFSFPIVALVTVTTASDTVAVKSAWPLIVFFKFVAVVLLFVCTWNWFVDGLPVTEVNTTVYPSFFFKVIVFPVPIFA